MSEHTCDECVHFNGEICKGQNEGQVRHGWWTACDGIEIADEMPLFEGAREAVKNLCIKRV